MNVVIVCCTIYSCVSHSFFNSLTHTLGVDDEMMSKSNKKVKKLSNSNQYIHSFVMNLYLIKYG